MIQISFPVGEMLEVILLTLRIDVNCFLAGLKNKYRPFVLSRYSIRVVLSPLNSQCSIPLTVYFFSAWMIWDFGADARTDIKGARKFRFRYICRCYVNILGECGYQILVTKVCNGGWISYQFVSKHQWTEENKLHFLVIKNKKNKPPSAGQTMKLYHLNH